MIVSYTKLCEEGGVLWLARDIMKLPQCEESNIMASVSRLKSKILSIMLLLCEVDSISFLDLAAGTTEGLDLAKSTVSEVLKLLRTMFCGNVNGVSPYNPRGILQLKAMRLTKILSDDSNFRSHIVSKFTEVLGRVFSLPHGEFMCSWCSSDGEAVEGDDTLNYDSFSESGEVLGVMSAASRASRSTFTPPRASETPFAQTKTSLLVKILVNLTGFVPDLGKEERGLFVKKFFQCLQRELCSLPDGVEHGGGGSGRAAASTRNLRSLYVHVGSLTPEFLNKDDVSFLRSFVMQMETLISQENSMNRVKEVVHNRRKSIPQRSYPGECNGNKGSDCARRGGVVDDEHGRDIDANNNNDKNIIETIGSDLSNMQLKNIGCDIMNINIVEEEEGVPEEERSEVKKRKRNVMNQVQKAMVEDAVRAEPDMQRRAASIQLWADRLSLHGSEVTSSQLKNWLNNRKAKLVRAAAAKLAPPVASSGEGEGEGEGSVTSGLLLLQHVSPDSTTDIPAAAADDPSSHASDHVAQLRINCGDTQTQTQTQSVSSGVATTTTTTAMGGCFNKRRKPGEYVVLSDGKGQEIGKGRIHQSKGSWFDTNLRETGLCVVDVTHLEVDETTHRLPHPCDATGTSFRDAQMILGRMRVLWESARLLPISPTPNTSY